MLVLGIYLDEVRGGGRGWWVGVASLILEKSRRSTCSFCSQVRSETSTLSPSPSLHIYINDVMVMSQSGCGLTSERQCPGLGKHC